MINSFVVLIILLIASGCSSVPKCSTLMFENEREQCVEADRRWQNESGWRYGRSY
jgi:uncharacterized protein YceK